MLKENWKKIVVHSVVLLTVATDASRRIDQGTSSSALNGNGFYSDGIPKREKIASQKESEFGYSQWEWIYSNGIPKKENSSSKEDLFRMPMFPRDVNNRIRKPI